MKISKNNLKDLAVSVIKKEAEAVSNLTPYIDDKFVDVLNLIYNSNGRLIVTGIGKSALIGTKIVATMFIHCLLHSIPDRFFSLH